MRILAWLSLLAFFSSPWLAKEQSSTPPNAPVFREPFTLKLRVDKQHPYEQHFDKVPYVAANDVYLFAGDKFGVNLRIDNNEISSVSYQPNEKQANVWFHFTQEKAGGGRLMMLLVTQNKLNRRLFYDAFMTIPGRDGVYKTRVLPVEARLSSFESWPQPIVRLVLRNLRFSANTNTQNTAEPKSFQ